MIKCLKGGVWTGVVLPYVISLGTWAHAAYDFLRAWARANGIEFLFAFLPGANALIPMLLASLLGLLVWRPVRGVLWRLFPKLSDWIAPDISGEWEAEYVSNFDRIKAMADAASNCVAPRYDAQNPASVEFGPRGKLNATIDLGWLDFKMTVTPATGKGPIEKSVTTAYDLRRRADGKAELAYVYNQKNRLDAVKATDRLEFLGAAILTIEDGRTMKGVYFTARNWECGLNPAGEISFTRVDPPGWLDKIRATFAWLAEPLRRLTKGAN